LPHTQNINLFWLIFFASGRKTRDFARRFLASHTNNVLLFLHRQAQIYLIASRHRVRRRVRQHQRCLRDRSRNNTSVFLL